MSDPDGAASRSTAVASASQALAMQELTEEIGGIRKQFKAMWITIGVVGTVTLILAVLTLLPRFGVRVGGTGTIQGRTGTFNGQQFNGDTNGTQQQTTPGQ